MEEASALNDSLLDVADSAAELAMIDTEALDITAQPLKRKFDALDIEDDAKIASGSGEPPKDGDDARRTPPSKLPEFKPSPEFWFEDGNIVLLVRLTRPLPRSSCSAANLIVFSTRSTILSSRLPTSSALLSFW